MTDMTAFETRIAEDVRDEVGPEETVDALAIARKARDTAPPPDALPSAVWSSHGSTATGMNPFSASRIRQGIPNFFPKTPSTLVAPRRGKRGRMIS